MASRGEVGLLGWLGEVFQGGVKGVAQGVGILDFSGLQLLHDGVIGLSPGCNVCLAAGRYFFQIDQLCIGYIEV